MDGRLFFGIGMGLMSVLGLTLAATAIDDIMYGVGFAFFGFGVLNLFALINRSVGRPDHRAETTGDAAEAQPGAGEEAAVPDAMPTEPGEAPAGDDMEIGHADRATG